MMIGWARNHSLEHDLPRARRCPFTRRRPGHPGRPSAPYFAPYLRTHQSDRNVFMGRQSAALWRVSPIATSTNRAERVSIACIFREPGRWQARAWLLLRHYGFRGQSRGRRSAVPSRASTAYRGGSPVLLERGDAWAFPPRSEKPRLGEAGLSHRGKARGGGRYIL